MQINGFGILKGIWVALAHFVESYTVDIKGGRKRYFTEEGVEARRTSDTKGLFTIQYPEEKLPVPEEFRYLPFLVYDIDDEGNKQIRCTACGICAKVCPPQCIWITRAVNPATGRPMPNPTIYNIDVDICMSCGFCAEFCPFDAIKMDHDYEITSYDRFADNIYTLEKLLKPASYYKQIRPKNFAIEEAVKAEKLAAKAAKQA